MTEEKLLARLFVPRPGNVELRDVNDLPHVVQERASTNEPRLDHNAEPMQRDEQQLRRLEHELRQPPCHGRNRLGGAVRNPPGAQRHAGKPSRNPSKVT